MMVFLGEHYLWLRALHLVSVICWMAGMLYLPRLFVYHSAASKGSELSQTFKIMEKRLMRYIMNPAMVATWVFGLTMLYVSPHLLEAPWMHLKLTCVLFMTVVHHLFALWRKDFEYDRNARTARFYRHANEIPSVLLVVIVIMAIVNPF